LKSGGAPSALASRRLDQWLWFARLVKSRSLAARVCIAGVVTVNQVTIKKANHLVRIGDTIAVPQRAFCRTIRVLSLGVRRGPAAEARLMYEEIARARLPEFKPVWQPLLMIEDSGQNDIP
jgi:ribosome-associated heat shock protein Hsp15